MEIFKVYPKGFEANSYILTADGKNAVVIDAASPSVEQEAERRNLVCKYVLLTHGHFDHVQGARALSEKGAAICCGEREEELIFSKDYLGMFGGVTVPKFEISRTFADGEEFTLCGINFKALSTPGHTAGGVSYIADNAIFTGDTLFFESVGRCDLPTGSAIDLQQSLKKLFALDKDYTIYPGHYNETTLNHERKFNPYNRF